MKYNYLYEVNRKELGKFPYKWESQDNVRMNNGEIFDMYLENVIEECAEDFYYHHDGWETSFPITICLFDEEGNLLGEKEVELDQRPCFNVSDVEEW